MTPQRLILPLILVALLPGWLTAGPIMDLFLRKPKVDPAIRVPALISLVLNDKDERTRAAALDELAIFDPKQFTEIYPTLIQAVQNDAAMNVRLTAVNAFGKLRPISQDVGYALEQVEYNDASPKVKTAATAVLRTYKVLGYNAGRTIDPKSDQTEEPPLASPFDALSKVKTPKSTGQLPVNLNPLRPSTPVQAIPAKAESKREGIFTLPSWLGGREKEKEPVPVKPVVFSREPKAEKSAQTPEPQIATPAQGKIILPKPVMPEPVKEEVSGPSLDLPK